MLDLKSTKLFRKELRKCINRGYDIKELNYVVEELRAGRQLDRRYQDHSLRGERKGQRDCHIKPDWVLIYEVDKQYGTLILLRTGSHSDLM